MPSNKWKISCFEILYQELGFDASSVTNLIVVGDSMNEVKAG
jgi:hydroxymethylpyrimidine pyrophosphatase-like HAD family hydrolase